jgi:hypothetical protein
VKIGQIYFKLKKVMAKKKFTFVAERVLVTAWTYSVLAEDADEALEMIENCPDGMCDDIYHHDDEKCYDDTIEFNLDDEEELDEEDIKKLEQRYKYVPWDGN